LVHGINPCVWLLCRFRRPVGIEGQATLYSAVSGKSKPSAEFCGWVGPSLEDAP
jgi:hypothetical protein